MNQVLKKWLSGILAVCVFVGLWWLASFLVQKSMLPSPRVVFQQLPKLLNYGMIAHLKASLVRVISGLFLSIVGGFCLGLLSTTIRSFFDPLLYLIYPIPKMALLPIVMLLGGLGDGSKVMMIVLIVGPQVTIAVRDGIREIPRDYYAVYQSLKISLWQQFKQITLPATLPAIISATRVSLGTALSILFFTENYGTEFGMGYFIMDAWTRMDYPTMYAGILILSSLGLLIFGLMDLLAKVYFRWQE